MYGVSRPTGYHWMTRYRVAGLAGLQERSRRPHSSPGATAASQVALILALRHRHPAYGPRKLLTCLRALPAGALAGDQHRRGDSEACGGRGAAAAPAADAAPGPAARPVTRANDVWSIDFKGQFRTRDGVWCYPLTVMDSWSRYLVTCQGLAAPRRALVVPVLVRAFREYGLPDRIRE